MVQRIIPFLVMAVLPIAAQTGQPSFRPEIPKVWDDAAMHEVELPLAAHIPVQHMPSDYYYSIPIRPNVKTYPIYVPGREPKGYWEWLKKQDPRPAFDITALRTKQDWTKAGELVFEAPKDFTRFDDPFTDVRNPKWYEYTGIRGNRNGIIPFYRYVIRKKGTVEVNLDSCTECHARQMSDGSVLKGAQGNVPFGRIWGYRLANDKAIDPKRPAKGISQHFFGAPWIQPDPTAPLSDKTIADFVAHVSSIPPGVNVRQGSSAIFPAQIPDLIGVKDRLYLDHTGLQQHRSIVDLMRYDAINNFIDEITSYAGFRPKAGRDGGLPDANEQARESDEELYALALFIYSLEPPKNPNPFDARAAAGKMVFEREGCGGCHTPPLYTNNMLTLAEGFKTPEDDRGKYRILNVSVGTDPFLATKTRRGTGYYKVPSLKGVWYRGPFEHNGSVATLEDWFDPSRLRDDYVPTGYRGYSVETRAVKGHEFGLKLTADDKAALITFLKTL
jgi:mono/diheme cytochrome c family protein